MPVKITGWSVIEIEIDEDLKSFMLKRVIKQEQFHELAKPGIRPTFIFYTSSRAQILVDGKGVFLLRFKHPKGTHKALSGIPKLYRLTNKSPLGRLAKKAMKQLLTSGKIKRI